MLLQDSNLNRHTEFWDGNKLDLDTAQGEWLIDVNGTTDLSVLVNHDVLCSVLQCAVNFFFLWVMSTVSDCLDWNFGTFIC